MGSGGLSAAPGTWAEGQGCGGLSHAVTTPRWCDPHGVGSRQLCGTRMSRAAVEGKWGRVDAGASGWSDEEQGWVPTWSASVVCTEPDIGMLAFLVDAWSYCKRR